MNVILILFLYVIIVNIVGFAMMGIDKRKAKRGAFRIPEANLFLTALVGGSIGCIAGMYTFRHKTKHKSFVFGMPAILIVQLAVILYLCLRHQYISRLCSKRNPPVWQNSQTGFLLCGRKIKHHSGAKRRADTP
ncbi:MAG: DUF1294 domain-containing protein [Eisenbergiella massiliensis]